MVRSEKSFDKRAKQLIGMILNKEDINDLPYEDLDIIALCIELGYLNSKYLIKTADGKYHFELSENSTITAEGIRFLSPKRDWQFIIPTVIAVVELVIIIIQAIQSA